MQKGTLKKSLLLLNIVPIILIGIILMAVSIEKVNSVLKSQVEVNLDALAKSIIMYMEALDSGDYRLEENTLNDEENIKDDVVLNSEALDEDNKEYTLYKGNTNLSCDFEYIDRIKEETNVEITFFYGDMRAVTTITDNTGKRLLLSPNL